MALPQRAAQTLVQDLLQVAIENLVAQGRPDRFQIGDEVAPHGHAQDAKLVRDRFDARRGTRCGRQCRAGTRFRASGRGGLRLRESAKEIRGCRAGAQGGHELADLLLGAAGGAVQDLAQTILLEDVAQLHESSQAEPAIAEVAENDRESCDQPSGGCPTKRRALRVPEMIDQERERGRKSKLQVELSPIELGQVSEELDEKLAFLLAELVEACGERVRRKLG